MRLLSVEHQGKEYDVRVTRIGKWRTRVSKRRRPRPRERKCFFASTDVWSESFTGYGNTLRSASGSCGKRLAILTNDLYFRHGDPLLGINHSSLTAGRRQTGILISCLRGIYLLLASRAFILWMIIYRW